MYTKEVTKRSVPANKGKDRSKRKEEEMVDI